MLYDAELVSFSVPDPKQFMVEELGHPFIVRQVEADLGQGFEQLLVTVKGAPCRLEKAQAAIFEALQALQFPDSKPCKPCQSMDSSATETN